MAQHPWLDPNPFHFPGGPVGALLIHGFTGAPTEMRPLGKFLAAKGYTVSGPLLPGHGTSVEDLGRCRRSEWLATVETAYDELAGRCEQVFVVGLSLGSLLAIHLGVRRPVSGLALLSPALRVADPLFKFSWIGALVPLVIPNKTGDSDAADPEADRRTYCYEAKPARAVNQVRLLNQNALRLLPAVTAPTLVVMSKGDQTLKFESATLVLDRINSTRKELLTLERSGHNVLVDVERERVWQATADFIARESKAAGELP